MVALLERVASCATLGMVVPACENLEAFRLHEILLNSFPVFQAPLLAGPMRLS